MTNSAQFLHQVGTRRAITSRDIYAEITRRQEELWNQMMSEIRANQAVELQREEEASAYVPVQMPERLSNTRTFPLN